MMVGSEGNATPHPANDTNPAGKSDSAHHPHARRETDCGGKIPTFVSQTLSNAESSVEQRISAYNQLASTMQERFSADKDAPNDLRALDDLRAAMRVAVTTAASDLQGAGDELVQAALHSLGHCLHCEAFASDLSGDESTKLLQALCETIRATSSKQTCTRALWCLSQQRLPPDLITTQLELLVRTIEVGQCEKNFQSMTIEHDALNANIRLLETVGGAMATHTTKWAKLVYPLLVHGAVKVRERALVAMELGMAAMLDHQGALAKPLAGDLRTMLIGELQKLMAGGEEMHCLKVWAMYVRLLGKLLHSGKLINDLLLIPEKGFKSANFAVKCQAYDAWRALIDNFAIDPAVLHDHRRVALILQVLCVTHVKSESVVMKKLDTWWHFVKVLGPKCCIYFEQVVVPLLQFSVNGVSCKPGTRTPKKLGIASPGRGMPSPGRVGVASPGKSAPPTFLFPQARLKGLEIVTMILAGASSRDKIIPGPAFVFSLEPLGYDVISGVPFFTKHASVLIETVKTALVSLGDDIPDALLYDVWCSLVAHVKSVLTVGSKRDCTDVFGLFLLALKSVSESSRLSMKKQLKLLEAVLCLPPRVLASAAYSVGGTTLLTQDNPAVFLIRILCSPANVCEGLKHDRFFFLFDKLLACGFGHVCGSVDFCQAATRIVDKVAAHVDDADALWRLWSAIARPLVDLITKTNEVNQGNNLEHDFGCLYDVLLFPVQHIMCRQLAPGTERQMMGLWQELYRTFARLAAMVPNADVNVWVEEFCAKMWAVLPLDSTVELHYVGQLLSVCDIIVENTALSTTQTDCILGNGKNGKTLWERNPAFGRWKQRPLGNLTLCVRLVGRLLSKLGAIIEQKDAAAARLLPAAITAIHVVDRLFKGVAVSTAISAMLQQLANGIAALFSSSKKVSSRQFSQPVNEKLDELLATISACLRERFNGACDTEFLGQVAPLFEASLLHARKSVRRQALGLWNATFGQSATLTYPESLRPTLTTLRETAAVRLPGWDGQGDAVVAVEDSPMTDVNGSQSQTVELPDFVALITSPHEARTSFLHTVSPPMIGAKSPQSRFVHTVGSSSSLVASSGSPSSRLAAPIPLADLDTTDEDFVVIMPSPKAKKPILTEHQREVMRSRTILPAMYNGLEYSQDGSQMGSLDGDTQIESQTPVTTPVFEKPNFHFAVPATKTKSKEVTVTTPNVPSEPVKTRGKRKSVAWLDEIKSTNSEEHAKNAQRCNGFTADGATEEPTTDRRSKRLSLLTTKTPSGGTNNASDEQRRAALLPSGGETQQQQQRASKCSQSIVSIAKTAPTSGETETRRLVPSIGRLLVAPSGELFADCGETPDLFLNSASHDGNTAATLSPANGSGDVESEEPVGTRNEEEDDSLVTDDDSREDVSTVADERGVEVTDCVVTLEALPRGDPTDEGTEDGRREDADDEERGQREDEDGSRRREDADSKRDEEHDSETSSETDARTDSEATAAYDVDETSGDDASSEPPRDVTNATSAAAAMGCHSVELFTAVDSATDGPSDDAVSDGERSPTTASPRSRSRSRKPPTWLRDMDVEPDRCSPQSAEKRRATAVTGDGGRTARWRTSLARTLSMTDEKEEQEGDGEEEGEGEGEREDVGDDGEKREWKEDGDEATAETTNGTEDGTRDKTGDEARYETMDETRYETIDKTRDETVVAQQSAFTAEKVNEDTVAPLLATDELIDERTVLVECSECEDSVIDLVSKEPDTEPCSIVGSSDEDSPIEIDLTVQSPTNDTAAAVATETASRTAEKTKTSAEKTKTSAEKTKTSAEKTKTSAEKTKTSADGKGKRGKKRKAAESDARSADESDDVPLVLLYAKLRVERATKRDRTKSTNRKATSGSDSGSDDVPLSWLTADATTTTAEEVLRKALSRVGGENGPLVVVGGDHQEAAPSLQTSLREVLSRVGGANEASAVAGGGRQAAAPSSSLREALSRVGGANEVSVVAGGGRQAAAPSSLERLERQLAIAMHSPTEKRLLRSAKTLHERSRHHRGEGSRPRRGEGSRRPRRCLRQRVTKSPAPLDAPTPVEATPAQTDTVATPPPLPAVVIVAETPPVVPEPARASGTTFAKQPTHQSRALLILQKARAVMRGKLPSRSADPPPPRRVGILKPAAAVGASVRPASPLGAGAAAFRPVSVGYVYSPAASPSGSILKRRRLGAAVAVAAQSPSPTAPEKKRRRVSFSDRVETREFQNGPVRGARSLTRDHPQRGVNRCLSMSRRRWSPLTAGTASRPSSTATGVSHRISHTPESSPSGSENGGTASTQESQLGCSAPIFAELVDCRVPVEQILPQLTSSIWVRGLEQLLRSRKLLTVGDLSALTEYAVHNLPIRSPKIVVMRRALQGFANSAGAKPPPPPPDSGATCEREAEATTTAEETMFDTSNDDVAVDTMLVLSSPMKHPHHLPAVEDELANLSPVKGELSTSIEYPAETCDERTPERETPAPCTDGATVAQEMGEIRRRLSQLDTSLLESDTLVALHQQLNGMMGDVVLALNRKCTRSSTDGQ